MYGREIIVQRTVIRWTYRSLPRPSASVPLRQAKASPVGRQAHEDGILPDKVRAVREIQGSVPHERRNAVPGITKRDPAPHRGQVTPWWKLGLDSD